MTPSRPLCKEFTLRPEPFGQWAALRDLGEYDLIVAGGGAAGSAAAITAARLGLSCLLIEPLSFLGGTGVAAQVTPWMGNHIDLGPLNEGLNAELQRDLEAQGEAAGYYVNPEALKILLEQKAIEAGVTLLFESQAAAVHGWQGDGAFTAAGVVVASRQGLARASARVLVDASGDAHLAHLAGAACREGRETDQAHQPMSLRFVLGNIELSAVRAFLHDLGSLTHTTPESFTHGQITPHFLELARREDWPQPWIDSFTIQFFALPARPGELWFNCPRLCGFDPLDPLSMSRAYVEGRRMIQAYLRLFRKHVPGARDAYLVMVAPMMGIREGRRIVGQYTLTADDFYQRRKFPDGICLNRYPIDIHNPRGRGATWIEMPERDWHEIPYRCLIPQGLRGLLVAGRCISSDFTAQASYRIIPNCRTMGEAAGVAAALARAVGSDVSQLDGAQLRDEMLHLALLPNWCRSYRPASQSSPPATSATLRFK